MPLKKLDPVLATFSLFTLEKPVWTAEEAACTLDLSLSSVYRYLASLNEVGLVTTATPGNYTLGPAILQLNLQLQLTDPLLLASQNIMAALIDYAPPDSTMLLCRYYGDRVLCVHQVIGEAPQTQVGHQRGRPMPLFQGAPSRAILAYLSPRTMRRVYDANVANISVIGLGNNWNEFRMALTRMRKSDFVVSYHEIDADRIAIAAPILELDLHALGSLSYVLSETDADPSLIRRLGALVSSAAREIGAKLRGEVPQDFK